MTFGKNSATRVLLVNPYIHDFSAYDFWAKPLGLMVLGGYLNSQGVETDYLDLVDPLSPFMPKSKELKRIEGRGRFHRESIPRPTVLPYIGRKFARYGLPISAAIQALESYYRPDAVLVTSMMTYWYPGVVETISLIKNIWPHVPVVLGGVYATLCPQHAADHSGADTIIPGPLENARTMLGELLSRKLSPFDPESMLPGHTLAPSADAAPLLTSRGCPFNCLYCGVKALYGKPVFLSPERVRREIDLIVGELGIKDIALYDDAFLSRPDRALEIMEIMASYTPIRIHAASGMGCRGLTKPVAKAMKSAGFTTIRLGLELGDDLAHKKMGGKVSVGEFQEAVSNLLAVGFNPDDIGAYVLTGLPGQSRQEVDQAVDIVLEGRHRSSSVRIFPCTQKPDV